MARARRRRPRLAADLRRRTGQPTRGRAGRRDDRLDELADGGIPEVYTADTDGGAAARRTYWGDVRTRVTGWTRDGEVLAVAARPADRASGPWATPCRWNAPPRLLPFGQVNDLALTRRAALLTAQRRDPANWKRYRGAPPGDLGARRGRPAVHPGARPPRRPARPDDDRRPAVFLSDHGTGNIYSVTLDGGDLRRHTDHDGFYAATRPRRQRRLPRGWRHLAARQPRPRRRARTGWTWR